MRLSQQQGRVLLAIARQAIAERLGIDWRAPLAVDRSASWLQRPAASFVTLREAGRLRGCIGTLQATRALKEDVAANAVAAAFHDPRFPPLVADEFSKITIEVSVLSEPEPLPSVEREEDLIRMLTPGKDGVVIQYGAHKATFLPQVWEELPDPKAFLAHLKRKAGLSEEFWSPKMRIWRYEVQKFFEGDDRDGA